jgi:hypothetical protein
VPGSWVSLTALVHAAFFQNVRGAGATMTRKWRPTVGAAAASLKRLWVRCGQQGVKRQERDPTSASKGTRHVFRQLLLSPNTVPRCVTGCLVVMRKLPLSYRRETSWKNKMR